MPVEMPPENTTEPHEKSRLIETWANLDTQERRITGLGTIVSLTVGGAVFGVRVYRENLPDPAVQSEMHQLDDTQAAVERDLNLLDASYNAIAQKDNPAYIAEIDYDGKPHDSDFPSLDAAADNQHLNEAFQAAKNDPVLGQYILRVVQADDENEGVGVLVEAQDNLYAQQSTAAAKERHLSRQDTELNFVPPLEAGFGTFVLLSASFVAAAKARRLCLRRQSNKVRAAEAEAQEAYIRSLINLEDPDLEDKLWAVVKKEGGLKDE